MATEALYIKSDVIFVHDLLSHPPVHLQSALDCLEDLIPWQHGANSCCEWFKNKMEKIVCVQHRCHLFSDGFDLCMVEP